MTLTITRTADPESVKVGFELTPDDMKAAFPNGGNTSLYYDLMSRAGGNRPANAYLATCSDVAKLVLDATAKVATNLNTTAAVEPQ